ncbi:hypothetical protein NDU88_002228 [Pleurodeles waltl]|uniref:Uncharacterized protein n=1 Tax=Pleurodeles waltl TaxID=8319 RepID=A0AAV7KSY9_PLEWA|nr:hypothetical protein NDU88_002228 [Pleurodeles waltl]
MWMTVGERAAEFLERRQQCPWGWGGRRKGEPGGDGKPGRGSKFQGLSRHNFPHERQQLSGVPEEGKGMGEEELWRPPYSLPPSLPPQVSPDSWTSTLCVRPEYTAAGGARSRDSEWFSVNVIAAALQFIWSCKHPEKNTRQVRENLCAHFDGPVG